MKLVSMLIAAFSIFFSGVIFAMDIPIYGFVDSQDVQPPLSTETIILTEGQLIDNEMSLVYSGNSRWRLTESAAELTVSIADTRRYWEVGWQVQHTAT